MHQRKQAKQATPASNNYDNEQEELQQPLSDYAPMQEQSKQRYQYNEYSTKKTIDFP